MSENKHTPEQPCPATLPFAILEQAMKDLMRFHECAMADEGYDVPKERMKRLAEIGLLRRVTANFYEHTIFGLSIINGDFQQKSEVEKQRDDLLAALVGLHKVCEIALAGKDGKQHTYFETRVGHFVEATESMREAEAAIASVKASCGAQSETAKIDPVSLLPDVRECCGTFPRTPHRSTCAKYRGKKGGAA